MFHVNVLIASASVSQNFGQIVTFGGSCTDPLLPMTVKLRVYSRPTVYAFLPKFVSIGLFCRPVAAKNRNFCLFLTSALSRVDSWQQNPFAHHQRSVKDSDDVSWQDKIGLYRFDNYLSQVIINVTTVNNSCFLPYSRYNKYGEFRIFQQDSAQTHYQRM